MLHANKVSGGFFPQQRKLMGSSAQISFGVCRCGSQEQVPEEGSGRFRRVPVCAGVGPGGRFRKVVYGGAGGSGRFRLGEFRHVLVYVAEASSGRFWRVPESSGVRWCRYRRQGSEGSEGSEEFRCGLLLCNLDRSSHVIVLNTSW